MAHEVLMPKFGQTVEAASVVRWLKNEGDQVAKGDVLLEIQTDKAELEVESFYDGTLLKVFASEGEEVPVMSVVGYIGAPGEEVPDAPPAPKAASKAEPAPKSKAAPRPRRTQAPSAPAAPAAAAVPLASAPAPPARFKITPRARMRAKEYLVDPHAISGSGPDGRIIERDVRAFIDEHNVAAMKASPVARRMMASEDVDILSVRPTGRNGTITAADVERVVNERPRPMPPMRRIIAERMTTSTHEAPHFYVTVRVDMTDLMAFRKEARREHGLKASVSDFIVKAAALTLREMPVVNSVCVGDAVRTYQDVNIGIAVALDDGLIVPVVKHADELSLAKLAETSKDLAARARDRKLTPDDCSGGTFTVSNMGMLGVYHFTAIINPGEGAILAVSEAVDTPVVRKGEIAVRTLMHMTLSADHRTIDGAVAAKFMKQLRTKLEDVAVWSRQT